MAGCSSCCSKDKNDPIGCDPSCEKAIRFPAPPEAQEIPDIVITSPSGASTADINSVDHGAMLHSTYEKNIQNAECLLPYVFRVTGQKSILTPSSVPMGIKAPPFHILVDHTLATVWCLCSKNAEDRKKLGVSQLQWALHFLKGLRFKNGEYSKDVALIMDTIEDYLIEKYADMSEAAMKTQAEMAACRCSVLRNLPKPVCDLCSNTKLMFEPRKVKSPLKPETIPDISTTKKPNVETFDKPGYVQKLFQSLPNTTCSSYASTNLSRLPPATATSTPYNTSGRDHVRKQIEDLRVQAVGICDEHIDLQNNPEAFAEMLYIMRQEQIDKIKIQVRQLKSIEGLIAEEEFQDVPDISVISSRTRTTTFSPI